MIFALIYLIGCIVAFIILCFIAGLTDEWAPIDVALMVVILWPLVIVCIPFVVAYMFGHYLSWK